jgi:hypothetical protein
MTKQGQSEYAHGKDENCGLGTPNFHLGSEVVMQRSYTLGQWSNTESDYASEDVVMSH